MSTVLSFDVWFWFWSYDLFGPVLLVGRDCLFLQVAWFFKIVRVMVNACIIWPNEEYFSDMFWLNSCVTCSKNWFCKNCLLYQWVYVTACMLFWHCWYNWSLTIFSNFFFPVFWSIEVPSSWKSSGNPIFFHCVFCGNMFCLTTSTKLFWFFLVLFFTNVSFSGQYLRFRCALVSALLSGVDEPVLCKSLSLVALVGLFLNLRDVTGLFHVTNWLSLDWFHIDLNESGTCSILTLKVWIFGWISRQAEAFDCDVILCLIGLLMILETDADRVLKIITALKYRPSFEWYFFKSSLLTRSSIYSWTVAVFQLYFFFLEMISVGEFFSAVWFFTRNSDFGLFLFWFTLVVMCTFWWTRDFGCIYWVRIDL